MARRGSRPTLNELSDRVLGFLVAQKISFSADELFVRLDDMSKAEADFALKRLHRDGHADVFESDVFTTSYRVNLPGIEFFESGGYSALSLREAARTPQTKPTTTPAANGRKKRTNFFAVVRWLKAHPAWAALIGAVTFVLGTLVSVWLDKNWDGHVTIDSFCKLFGAP